MDPLEMLAEATETLRRRTAERATAATALHIAEREYTLAVEAFYAAIDKLTDGVLPARQKE